MQNIDEAANIGPKQTSASVTFVGVPRAQEQIHLINRFKDEGRFEFTGYPNEKGFLGKIVSAPFRAKNRNDAEQKAYRVLSGSLSNISIHQDIPLEIVQRETVELLTGNTQTSISIPFLEAPLAIAPTAQPSTEFRGYASLYREALGTASTVYRFLCLYKIVEAIKARRTRALRQAKRAGVPAPTHQEVLPSNDKEVVKWLNALFPIKPDWDAMALATAVPQEIRGKELMDAIEGTLSPLRVNIAHALLTPSGELTMSVDELLHINQVNRWVTFLKCAVRRLLKNEFPKEFLPYLKEDGTIVP